METLTDTLTLDCAELSTREINSRLKALPDGSSARILNPGGRHNLAVGLSNKIDIRIEGHAGYFIGGLGDGPDILVDGFVGWSVGENLMSGSVRVKGHASASAAATAHGGLVIVEGDASARAGISLKGGTLAVGGNVGHMCGFMAQAGTILVGGNAGFALGDSLYEAVIYIAGSIDSLGADARVEEMTQADVDTVRDLVERTGLDHIDPENVKRVASAKTLYHFSGMKERKF